MEFNGISDEMKGFSSLKNPEISNLSKENILETLGKEKMDSLKNSIYEIKKLIEERENLSSRFIQEGESLKSELNNFLLENESFSNHPGINQGDFIKEKNGLRSKKIEISELQLNEKIDCWKDVALLKKELRINEMELNEKQERLISLNKLLEEN